ncbi:MAG TPA: hypothetical protein VHC44_19675, partial [Verrucomicrobiae bacterium]|nr:hypothetical protein [Verrucomicrobiae bacterium]
RRSYQFVKRKDPTRGTKKSASFIFPTLARWGTPANLYRSMGNNKFSVQMRQAAIPGITGRVWVFLRRWNGCLMEIFCNFWQGVPSSFTHDTTLGAGGL